MSLSLSEFEALCKKAIRGAGYSWGLAEDGARACRALATFDIPSGDMLAALLAQSDGLSHTERLAFCPLCVGAALCDIPPSSSRDISALSQPDLLIPFLQMACVSNDTGFLLQTTTHSTQISRQSLVRSARTSPTASVSPCAPPSAATTRVSRITLSASTSGALLELAHRTYAPATEASRLSGAGAGLSDND